MINGGWFIVSGIMGFLAVALGAFGAHGLKNKLDAYSMGVFQTAVQYHISHAIVLLILAFGLTFIPRVTTSNAAHVSAWAFTLGILIFSGSLYALALTGNTKLGAITPIGGLGFLIGWAGIAYMGYQFTSRTT